MNDPLWFGCSQAALGRPARGGAHDRHNHADELSDGEYDEEEVRSARPCASCPRHHHFLAYRRYPPAHVHHRLRRTMPSA